MFSVFSFSYSIFAPLLQLPIFPDSVYFSPGQFLSISSQLSQSLSQPNENSIIRGDLNGGKKFPNQDLLKYQQLQKKEKKWPHQLCINQQTINPFDLNLQKYHRRTKAV